MVPAPSSSANIVIAGATGVVGSRVLARLLARSDVAHVTAVGRRPPALTDPKLTAPVVDLRDVAALEGVMPAGVDTALCCLGTTMKQAGSQDAFRAVDHDAVLAFARAARQRGARRLVLVSSAGASARSGNFYLKTKGEAEDAVAALDYEQVTVLRPSFIDDQGTRTEVRPGERFVLPIARVVFAVIGRTSRYAPITADVLASAVMRLTFDAPPDRLRVVESDRLQILGRL
jgi:uncharacterized protein YbjT (DUF2867 family)